MALVRVAGRGFEVHGVVLLLRCSVGHRIVSPTALLASPPLALFCGNLGYAEKDNVGDCLLVSKFLNVLDDLRESQTDSVKTYMYDLVTMF